MKPPVKRRRATPEADAQRGIVRFLRQILWPGSIVHCSPNEQTSALRQAVNVGMGVHAGFSDLIVLARGHVLFLEVKAARGVQSEVQRRFQALVEMQGFPYEIIRTEADALAALDRHRVPHRVKSPKGTPPSRVHLHPVEGDRKCR